jgi:hypothetical protein
LAGLRRIIMIRYSIAFENNSIGADFSFRAVKSALKFLIWGLKNGKKPRVKIYLAKYRRIK